MIPYPPINFTGPATPKETVKGSLRPEPRRLHELKIEERFLNEVLRGEKRAEFRKNDRGFQAGDYLLLKADDDYTGLVRVTHILHDFDFKELPEGYCILSIELILPLR